jgi:hypothetical protein
LRNFEKNLEKIEILITKKKSSLLKFWDFVKKFSIKSDEFIPPPPNQILKNFTASPPLALGTLPNTEHKCERIKSFEKYA